MPVPQATAASLFMENTARRRAISRIQSGGPLAATLGIPLLTTIAMASLAGRIHRCFGAGTWDSAHPPKDARPGRNCEQRGAQNRVADFSQIEG
jgi:hypothetical protein